jgi:arsenical pump membrane protein
VACVAGGVFAVALGIVPPIAAARAVIDQWDVLAFLAGLLLVSWVAEAAGLFRWTALAAARVAHGSTTRLFVFVCLAGVLLTTLLSNDATALLLTTAVCGLCVELEQPVLPFVLACAFLANSASMTLPTSNPLNVLVMGADRVDLGTYLVHLLPASACAIVLTVGALWFLHRESLQRHFDGRCVAAPSTARCRPVLFRLTIVVLVALGAGYLLAAALAWPLSLPVVVAGIALLLTVHFGSDIPVRRVATAPWSIIPFVAGLLVVVAALERTGLTRALGAHLLALDGHGAGVGLFGTTFAAAMGSNALNNLPMGAVMVSTLHSAGARAHPALLCGLLLGADVGPNLAVFGSLSSMSWLLLLRRQGVCISGWDFARVGLMITPLILIAGATAIALTL